MNIITSFTSRPCVEDVVHKSSAPTNSAVHSLAAELLPPTIKLPPKELDNENEVVAGVPLT